jgi:hypothetical protein
MTGAHRRADIDPVTLEGIRALLWLLGFLAVVGVFAYFLVTDWKDLQILTLALQALIAATYVKRLVVKVLRNRAPSPKVLAGWIGDSAIVIVWVAIVLASFGRIQGWMHGAFEYVMYSTFGLLAVGMPVYWWRGRQQIVLSLTARAVAGRWPWSAGG